MKKVKILLIASYLFFCLPKGNSQTTLCLNTPTFSPLLVNIPVFQKCFADLNNDNQLDLIMPAYAGFNFFITVALSNGNNQYQSCIQYSCDINPYHVESADFNNDGNKDVLCVSYDSSKVLILNGNGTGTFTSSTKYSVSLNPLTARCKDINSDGMIDIITAGANSLSILVNNGNSLFSSVANYTTNLSDPRLILSDFDNDNLADIFVYDNSNSKMFKNLGNGTLQSINSSTYNFNCLSNSPFDANQVLSFDLNNDSKMDLIGISYQSISVYYGNGNFSFSTPSLFPSGLTAFTLLSLSKGDINGDGFSDVVGVNYRDTVSILLNSGSGGFQSPILHLIPEDYPPFQTVKSGKHIDACDIDNNGKIDIVIGKDNSGYLSFLYNCSVTSINNRNDFTANLEVIPNPSSGIFRLKFDTDVKNLKVFDMNGRIIVQNSHNREIDLRNNNNGVYFLKIETTEGEFMNYKLIKTD